MLSPLHFWRRYQRTRGSQRELLALGVCLGAGLLLMPPLIWSIGSAKLGPYAGGGLFALWRDYLLALIRGSVAFWLVALGPYAALWLLRAARFWFRR
jgi:hypothetical protein